MRRPSIVFVVALIAVLLAGCAALGEPGDQTGSPVPTPTEAPFSANLPDATKEPVAEPTPSTPAGQLRVWLPPEIGSRTPGAAEALTSQLREFNARHPELELVVEQKPVEGPGGILNYLRAGADVAPDILPDVIALPGYAFESAAITELVTPLDGLVSEAGMTDLFPAAEAQVSRDGLMYGVPFALTDLAHLVYAPNTQAGDLATEAVSLDWTSFITNTANTLTLPADSRDGALFGLQFYLASGGRITNDAGQAILEVEPLEAAVDQIRLGRANLGQSYQLKSLDEAWQTYRAGLSNHVWTRSDFQLGMLADESAPEPQVNSPVPGPGGPLTPRVSGWAWAISTDDPDRQTLAAELIDFLVEPSKLSTWLLASQTLPPRRDVLPALSQQRPYYAFVGRELERAQAMPAAASGRLMEALGIAVYEALTSDKPSRQIAEEAVLSLQQR